MRPLWANCTRIVAAMLAPLLTGSPALSQDAANPPKLQKQLQRIADGFTRTEMGPVIQTGVLIEDHRLVIQFEPASGINPALALKSMKETNWDRGICRNKDALGFMNNERVTVRVVLVQAGQAPVQVSDVTAASCARETSITPALSRMIGGVAFAPRPTKEQALARVRTYVETNFFDPDAAQIKCAEPGPAAWLKPVLERRRYGYFMNCNINGKNSFGGYVGFEPYFFRMNGDEFERMSPNDGSSGLMEPAK